MREKFIGFYQPEEDDLKEIWETAIVCFDANALLNLYRYTQETQDDFFEILEHLSNAERLYLPYQAGLEYHTNRLTVISAQKKAYETLKQSLKDLKNKVEADFKPFKRHPYLPVDDMLVKIDEVLMEINETLQDLDDEHPNFIDADPTLDKITELLPSLRGHPHTYQ
jgi:hypothetical protein